MKAVIVALCLAGTVSTGVYAREYTKDEVCREVGLMANLIMGFRQSLLPMSHMMAIYEDHPVGREMVIAAYEYPRIQTQEATKQIKAMFSDEWSLKCYKDELSGPVTWLAE